jgi:hypothetical protein
MVVRDPFIVQSIGLAITAIGVLALIAFMTILGRPLSEEERYRMGSERRNLYRLPINIETIVSTLILASGIGILVWSNFDHCLYIMHWAPNLPDTVMSMLRCN